jgi:hypothetical protein
MTEAAGASPAAASITLGRRNQLALILSLIHFENDDTRV